MVLEGMIGGYGAEVSSGVSYDGEQDSESHGAEKRALKFRDQVPRKEMT